jgi:hypothetical protein
MVVVKLLQDLICVEYLPEKFRKNHDSDSGNSSNNSRSPLINVSG